MDTVNFTITLDKDRYKILNDFYEKSGTNINSAFEHFINSTIFTCGFKIFEIDVPAFTEKI